MNTFSKRFVHIKLNLLLNIIARTIYMKITTVYQSSRHNQHRSGPKTTSQWPPPTVLQQQSQQQTQPQQQTVEPVSALQVVLVDNVISM
jgi:hypothetical protein